MRDHRVRRSKPYGFLRRAFQEKGAASAKILAQEWGGEGRACEGVPGTANREHIVKNSLISPANWCRALKHKEEIQS